VDFQARRFAPSGAQIRAAACAESCNQKNARQETNYHARSGKDLQFVSAKTIVRYGVRGHPHNRAGRWK
jgi:hypothetical protein